MVTSEREEQMKEIMSFLVGDGEKCKQCLACQAACPSGDIKFVPFQYKNAKLIYRESLEKEYPARMCSVCLEPGRHPICMGVCPQEALSMINVRQERKTKNKQAVIYLHKYWGGRKKS